MDYIVSHKTGALFEAAVKLAGMFKGVGKKKIDALGNFGRCIGFTFQLVDDLMDKDGYAGIYSAEHVKKMAGLLTKRAKAHLDIFGKKANMLSRIADFILERRS
ncbi:MAG: polyprenyl synthetase family protein [Pseudomonadota bacterium]